MIELTPKDIEIENVIIGSLLVDSTAMNDVVELLKSEMFFDVANKLIFEACIDLYKKVQPIDLLTVTQKLRENLQLAAVGVSTISEKCYRVISGNNIVAYSYIIIQLYIKRELLALTYQLTTDCHNDSKDVFELISEAENALFSLTKSIHKKQARKISDLYDSQIKSIEQSRDGYGVPSGFAQLDSVISGFKPGELIILAARPSMGKTAYAVSMAVNQSLNRKIPVAFFSMEMSEMQVTNRITSIIREIPLRFLINQDVHGQMFERLMLGVPILKDVPLYIDDTGAIKLMELRSKLRKLVIREGVKIAFIDYLGLMGADRQKGKNREQEVSEFSAGLKSIAKELDIPIVALCQLNREVEKRGDRRPQLSDLRDSGSIEQDADMVMFLFRPEYHNIKNDENGQAIAEGHTEIIIAKNRNGGIGSVEAHFNKEYAKFSNISFGYETSTEPIRATKKEDPF